MTNDLDQIDTATIEQLQELKEQREISEDRLQQLEDKRGSVPQEVYERVRVDYERRRDELSRESRPLQERARAEYSKLKKLHGEIVAEHEDGKLDREEAELRHDLGEYDDREFTTRIEYLDATLKGQEERLQASEKLRDRFIAAFSSPDELESTAEEASASDSAELNEDDGDIPPPEGAGDDGPGETGALPVPPPLELDEPEL